MMAVRENVETRLTGAVGRNKQNRRPAMCDAVSGGERRKSKEKKGGFVDGQRRSCRGFNLRGDAMRPSRWRVAAKIFTN